MPPSQDANHVHRSLRRRVAFEAAKLIYAHEETQYGRAKMKAARRLVSGQVKPDDLPCNREIRRCIQTIARTSRAEQEQLLTQVSADRALGRPTEADENTVDRFRTYELLLAPLEDVMQSPENHPEGDVLYHSLQVFELARQKLPYDEEFLLAALLHDVGKAIDRRDHVAAGLEALAGAVSPRTAWLIEHHVEALSLRDGTLGVRTAPPARSGRGFRRVDALGRLRPARPGRGPARRPTCGMRSTTSASWPRRAGISSLCQRHVPKQTPDAREAVLGISAHPRLPLCVPHGRLAHFRGTCYTEG